MLTLDDARIGAEALFASALGVPIGLVSLTTLGVTVGPLEPEQLIALAEKHRAQVEREQAIAPSPGLFGMTCGTMLGAFVRVGDGEDAMLIHLTSTVVPAPRPVPTPDFAACLAAQRGAR